jgi:pimeloyl-ACP methyl ester carboxylesterase
MDAAREEREENEPVINPPHQPRPGTRSRVIALLLAVGMLLALAYPGLSKAAPLSVPPGTRAGQLVGLRSCTFPTESGSYRADCGTLVVPEDWASPRSRLIALPVVRIRARSARPLAPVFYLNGGPGLTNMKFAQASRLAAQHDIVLVGYRGVDGSSVLNCPEVTSALAGSADLLSAASIRAEAQAFAACAQRLQRSGVDLAGYTMAEMASDMEAARVALGYHHIDLVGESAGTRLAQIYMWRYPKNVDHAVLIGVNPPGNFVYNGDILDQQLQRYSTLCAQDPTCHAGTGNLAASMRHTAANLPRRWLFLPIKGGNVLVSTQLGMADTIASGPPLVAPVILNSWISAAHGDPSGLWLMSLLGGLIVPTSFTWGQAASIVRLDADPAARYFSSAAGHGSIIGDPASDVLWAGGGLVSAWPADPSRSQYATVPDSDVSTLLIGGTVDVQTPAQNATRELLPHLRNGHQVILSELGHAPDFWNFDRSASTRLLTTFLATGRVDTSLYRHHVISFNTVTFPAIAEYLLALMLGFVAMAAAVLLWAALRVRLRGATGRKISLAMRSVLALAAGLGGWFAGALIVLTFWTTVPLSSEPLGIVSVGVPVALVLYLAWTRRDAGRAAKATGLLAASGGALIGGWYGYTVIPGFTGLFATIIGAIAAGNIALIALGLSGVLSRRSAAAPAPQSGREPLA